MPVLHVENQETTRAALADLMEVEDGQVEGTKHMGTGSFGVAEGRLRKGRVQALVLDLGLNPEWDNHNLPRVLKRLAQGLEIAPEDEAEFYAYRLALIAHEREVPCAVLTNFPEYIGLNEERAENLLAALHAEKFFRKDEEGLTQCAAWVHENLA